MAQKNQPHKSLSLGVQYRTYPIRREDIKEDDRTLEISFSSEAEIEKYWGIEILGHDKGEIILDTLNARSALLVNHNPDEQVGVVEKADVMNHRGRAKVRFSRSARADEIYQDVLDLIRTQVSVGYIIREMKLIKEVNGVSYYRVTKWEPFELSFVSIAADTSVGYGREKEDNTYPVIIIREQEEQMGEKETQQAPEQHTAQVTPPEPVSPIQVRAGAVPEAKLNIEVRTVEPERKPKIEEHTAPTKPTIDMNAEREAVRNAELARISEITAISKDFKLETLGNQYVKEGRSVAEFKDEVMKFMMGKQATVVTTSPELGMSDKEAKRFSIYRAIEASITGNWNQAGFEREVSDAYAKQVRKSARSFFIPPDVLKQRTIPLMRESRVLSKSVPAEGGYLIEEELQSTSFIELLRNTMLLTRLGARVLSDLVGDIAIPRQTGGVSTFWVADGQKVTESTPTFDQVPLAPKSIASCVDIHRKMLIQPIIAMEEFTKQDIAIAIAMGIDRAGFLGSGIGQEPRGVFNTPGIGSVVTGGTVTEDYIIDLETAVDHENALTNTVSYVTSPKVKGVLKKTRINDQYGETKVWTQGREAGMGLLNNYDAHVTRQIPDTHLGFGNWYDIIIGEWSGLDVLVDPYSKAKEGTVSIITYKDIDIAVRHPESFSLCSDIVIS